MYVYQHIILGFLFSMLCFFLFPLIGLTGTSLIFFSSVLIDIDHYIYYAYKKKDFSLKNAHKWFIKKIDSFFSIPFKERNNVYVSLCFFHGIEILTIILFLAIFSKYFIFVFAGFSFHILLDLISEAGDMKRTDKVFLIKDFFKYKKLDFIENVK